MSRAVVIVVAVLLLLPGSGVACSSCPPDWLAETPSEAGWLYAAGSCGAVFVDADASALAMSRAARRLADTLGLDVEHRLSVRRFDGHVFVEAVGAEGPTAALDELEVVDLVHCDGTVHALLRLPAPP